MDGRWAGGVDVEAVGGGVGLARLINRSGVVCDFSLLILAIAVHVADLIC